jgi:hypothetical protein
LLAARTLPILFSFDKLQPCMAAASLLINSSLAVLCKLNAKKVRTLTATLANPTHQRCILLFKKPG